MRGLWKEMVQVYRRRVRSKRGKDKYSTSLLVKLPRSVSLLYLMGMFNEVVLHTVGDCSLSQ